MRERYRGACTAVNLAIGVAIAAYYLWAAQAGGRSFVFHQDLGGYYDLLAQGFARGHLYLPITPPKELLALPDPWDPAVNRRYTLHDAVLFHDRYYLLHLPAPAVTLFLPWRLLTGHDLPENFALFLFCFAGFAFSAASLLRLLQLADARPGPLLTALMLFALGICQGVPYLFSTILVYQVAIGAAYCFASVAIYFLARAAADARVRWCAASGAMWGLAMASRPHMAFAAVATLAAVILLRRSRRHTLAYMMPLAIAALLVAVYNYARFGSIFEFGDHYQLSGIRDGHLILAGRNVLPGLYYFLFCAPDWSAVFPWVRLVLRFPFDSASYPLPPRYSLEPTAGGLWSAPLAIAVAAVPFLRGLNSTVKLLLWTVLASAAAMLLFLGATGFTTQRYEVDFLPLLVWAALATIAFSRFPRWIAAALIAAGALVSLALGISGPNDDMLKNRPEAYLRIAAAFSPIERFRPVLNPPLALAFTAQFSPQSDRFREPLLTAGRQAYRYYLYAEHVGGKVRIASYTESSEIDCVVESGSPAHFTVEYDPSARVMHIAIDGQERLTHPIGNLVTAPADITLGENRIDPNVTEPRFTGRLRRDAP